jgi:hypothetical protein
MGVLSYIFQCKLIIYAYIIYVGITTVIEKEEQLHHPSSLSSYIPKGENVVQRILKEHFEEFREQYEARYARNYGKYRLERIEQVVEEFLKCGNYKEGLARVKCLNPECGHDYFVPLSCLCFYFCPSCHQKRTLLFGEQMAEVVLLSLPHRQFVFTFPKCLRVYFKHNRLLYADVSQLIVKLIQEYYNLVSMKSIQTGVILAYQTAGTYFRWNSHFHSIVMEGGFDSEGNFIYLPIANTVKMTEAFRRRVIQLFVEKKLITGGFARSLLSWQHSGFSIDNSVKIPKDDKKTIEALAQYIARCPISLENIEYRPATKEVIVKAGKYSPYFKEESKVFKVLDFIALISQHIPPKHKQYIRRYGLYASRTRGVWERSSFIVKLTPSGWKETHSIKINNVEDEAKVGEGEQAPNKKKQNSTWARLIKKVYGIDPLTCPKCGSDMEILAIILDPTQTKKILTHLVKVGRSPPNFDTTSLN